MKIARIAAMVIVATTIIALGIALRSGTAEEAKPAPPSAAPRPKPAAPAPTTNKPRETPPAVTPDAPAPKATKTTGDP